MSEQFGLPTEVTPAEIAREKTLGGDPEFIGRVFQVTEIANPESLFFGSYWDTQPHQRRAGEPGVIVVFADSTLQPLRPDEAPESVETEKTAEVAA